MARKPSPTLTEAELRLMQVLWKQGPATVAQVSQALPERRPLAYTTVLTMLRILEKKGCLRHRKAGRAHVYEPLLDEAKAGRQAIKYLVSRFFKNSPELLMLNILESERMDLKELKRLRKLIRQAG